MPFVGPDRGLRLHLCAGMAGLFEDIRGRAEQAFEGALAEMPPGFSEGRAVSVRRGFEQREVRLVAENDGWSFAVPVIKACGAQKAEFAKSCPRRI